MNTVSFGSIPANAPSCVAERIDYRYHEQARAWVVRVVFVDFTFVTFWRDRIEEVHEIIDAIRDDNAHALAA